MDEYELHVSKNEMQRVESVLISCPRCEEEIPADEFSCPMCGEVIWVGHGHVERNRSSDFRE